MEEKKTAGKEVRMNANASKEKLSYDKLEQLCGQLSEQNRQMEEYIKKLHRELGGMNEALQYRRMDYLFKVVELSVSSCKDSDYPCFSGSFVEECISEIQEAMSPKESTVNKEDK